MNLFFTSTIVYTVYMYIFYAYNPHVIRSFFVNINQFNKSVSSRYITTTACELHETETLISRESVPCTDLVLQTSMVHFNVCLATKYF